MLQIAPFKQTDDSRCGPACIKMVLDFYGIEATEDEICERCNHTYELGCTNEQMRAAIESYGLSCSIHNHATLGSIKLWLQKHKSPIIVDWFSPGVNPELGDMPEGHSSIVVDIDEERIHLLDPELGGVRSIKHNDFLRCWFDWKNSSTIDKGEMVVRQVMIIEK